MPTYLVKNSRPEDLPSTISRAVTPSAIILALLFSLSGCETQSTEADSPTLRLRTRLEKARWHNNQGVVYMDQHNYARATTEFKRSTELAPDYANGLANLGIAHFSLGQYDSAAVNLQAALNSDRNNLHAHYTLGLIFNAQGREYERALAGFERVLQSDPDDPLVRYYVGQVMSKLGRSEEALTELLEAIRLDPTNVSAYYALANQFRSLGRQSDWEQALAKFNELSQAGHQGISASYQGQGKYAEVVVDASLADEGRDDTKGPFRFVPTDRHVPIEKELRFAALGELDGTPGNELLVGNPGLTVFRTTDDLPGSVRDFWPVVSSQRVSAATVADWNNDGYPDVALSAEPTLLLQSDEDSRWTVVDSLISSQTVVFADVDHDGDLDLLTLGLSGAALFFNDGNGSFEEITEQSGLNAGSSPGTPALRAVFSDIDNDRDIDLVLLRPESIELFSNNRDGTFSEIADSMNLESLDAVDLVMEDFNGDGFMDLLSISESGAVDMFDNRLGERFDHRTSAPVAMSAGNRIEAADLDNDGDLDLLVHGPRGIEIFACFEGEYQTVESNLPETARSLLIDDIDRDGALDLWVDGHEWRNDSPAANWISLSLEGLNSNRDAIGTKVEVKTARNQIKREIRGDSRNSRVLHFGLAAEDSVEFIRVLWPGGVRQTELAAAGAQQIDLTELDRKGTSCPILYAWDGTGFRFVTDILGGAIIGYLLGPGEYYYPDTDEYVPLGRISAKEGKYILKIANQLEEIIYLDKVELVAVDHGTDFRVFPNERLLSAPPYPEFIPYAMTDLRPPRSAVDHLGRDFTGALLEKDDVWYDGFRKTDIHGYVEEHSLTLDFGNLRNIQRPVLLAHGWVDYAHSTSNWAAAQRGLALRPPKLEVVDDDGEWVTASIDMGTPAGLPKMMLYDLSGAFVSEDYRLRISTNAAIYWDQFTVGSAAETPMQVHRMLPTNSDLAWRGYPRHTAINGTFAFRYDYDDLVKQADWGTHGGRFTRLGEVGELLTEIDDRYVIMFHGDELTVEFAATELPPLDEESGYAREFLLFADGYGKDMDLHSAHSLTVGPLPFHGMSAYPYPPGEDYPHSEEHMRYNLEYNTRAVKGFYE